jgi:hypothetical protein
MQVPMVGLATFFSDFSSHVTVWAEPKKYFFQSPKPNWLTLSQLHFFRKIRQVGSNVSNFKKNKICTKVAFSHFSPIELFIPRRLVQVPCRSDVYFSRYGLFELNIPSPPFSKNCRGGATIII